MHMFRTGHIDHMRPKTTVRLVGKYFHITYPVIINFVDGSTEIIRSAK